MLIGLFGAVAILSYGQTNQNRKIGYSWGKRKKINLNVAIVISFWFVLTRFLCIAPMRLYLHVLTDNSRHINPKTFVVVKTQFLSQNKPIRQL